MVCKALNRRDVAYNVSVNELEAVKQKAKALAVAPDKNDRSTYSTS